MAGMKWLWRLICSPNCGDACQAHCPGCRAMAEEWAAQGHVRSVSGQTAGNFRWRNLLHLSPGSIRRARHDQNLDTREGGGDACRIGCGCDPRVQSGQEEQAHAAISAEVNRLPADISSTVMYSTAELQALPDDAIRASLGSGNPFARAELRAGEIVLDLGCGGGMDALVEAAHVSPGGHVFGLDASDDMLRLANANASQAGVTNVAFIKGDLEAIPLPSSSVDVIISNCAVNLTPDKQRAFREAYRVLRPRGRLALSDIVTATSVPPQLRADLTAWDACVGGALSEAEYREYLTAAGFTDVVIERDSEYTMADAEAAGLLPVLRQAGLDDALRLGFASTSICARKDGVPTRTVLADSAIAQRNGAIDHTTSEEAPSRGGIT